MTANIVVRNAVESDIKAITQIYNHYIDTSIATFEEASVQPDEMLDRHETITSIHKLPYLVAIQDAQVVGYAYAGPLKARSAYRFAVENSVYIAPNNSRKGIGRLLVQGTMSELEKRGIKTMLACISLDPGQKLEDNASCGLHLAMGCRFAGRWERVGVKFGRWIDVVWLQIDFGERPEVRGS